MYDYSGPYYSISSNIPEMCPNCNQPVMIDSHAQYGTRIYCDTCNYSVTARTRSEAEYKWLSLVLDYQMGFPPDQLDRKRAYVKELYESGIATWDPINSIQITDEEAYEQLKKKWGVK